MPSPYTGDPTAVQAPSSAPGPGVAPIVDIPSDTTDDMNTASVAQSMKVSADFIAWLMREGGSGACGFYGDGSDGNVTIGAGTTTLARDMYYNNLTLGATSILYTAGFRIFVAGTLTIAAGGYIHNNGGNGNDGTTSGGTGGASATPGSLFGSVVGVAGGTGSGVGGTGTASLSNSLGGAGGAGGAGTSGTVAGGPGGTVSAPAPGVGGIRHLPGLLSGFLVGGTGGTPIVGITGGAGGGGGGGSGASTGGGGGGGGGGPLILAARYCVLANPVSGILFAIQAVGGKGGNGGGASNGGGGGGGGGGPLIFVTRVINGASRTLALAQTYASCAGGAGGTAASPGANGVAGSAGTFVSATL